MHELLNKIEFEKQKWVDRKDTHKRIKFRLQELEDQLTEARAELVATAGMLDQNDKLRSKIQEEERQKARYIIEKEINDAKAKLDEERLRSRGSIEAVFEFKLSIAEAQANELSVERELVAKERDELLKQNKKLQEKVDSFEEKLAEKETEYDVAASEADDLAEEKTFLQAQLDELQEQGRKKEELLQKQIDELKKETKQKLSIQEAQHRDEIEEMRFHIFQTLMQSFEQERQELLGKIDSTQSLLKDAAKVIRIHINYIPHYIY